jgi:predicted nuclease of predicted toxin-antitoxin system
MRVLLDEHVSDRGVGAPLRARGHDVLALNRHPTLFGLSDLEVARLATREERIVVTHNAGHFAALARMLGAGSQSHAGMVLVTLPHQSFGLILRGLDDVLAAVPDQSDWRNRVVFIGRAAGPES